MALSVGTERVQIPIFCHQQLQRAKEIWVFFFQTVTFCMYEFRELLSGVGRIRQQAALRRIAETAVIPHRRH
jgi:hypothetical protein